MKNKLSVFYDVEGDILEVYTEKSESCYMKDIGNDVFEIVDENTEEIKGFVIINFKARSKESGTLNLPFDIKFATEI